MKDIRIFVASSKELIAERNQLAFLVLSMEEEFAARGLRVYCGKEIPINDAGAFGCACAMAGGWAQGVVSLVPHLGISCVRKRRD